MFFIPWSHLSLIFGQTTLCSQCPNWMLTSFHGLPQVPWVKLLLCAYVMSLWGCDAWSLHTEWLSSLASSKMLIECIMDLPEEQQLEFIRALCKLFSCWPSYLPSTHLRVPSRGPTNAVGAVAQLLGHCTPFKDDVREVSSSVTY